MSHIRHIESKFEKIGARATIRHMTRGSFRRHGRPLVIDVLRTEAGEVFDIEKTRAVQLSVLDVQRRQHHLLLLAENWVGSDQFLCGHDERRWFVAALPEGSEVRTVQDARESLKPTAVRRKERREQGRRRKSDVHIRQGEWFFIPAPDVQVNDKLILINEPISRGRGKPHMCEELYREGGTTVYVCSRHPNGLTVERYRKLLKKNSEAAKWNWQVMRRNPVVYVRGKIWHPDHATIRLDVWHRVEMNTENRSRAMAQVAFLD